MNNTTFKALIKYKRFFSIKKLKGSYYRVHLKQVASSKYLRGETMNLDGVYLARYNESFFLSYIIKQNITLKIIQKRKPVTSIEHIEILHFLRPIRNFKNEDQAELQKKMDFGLAQYLINNETFLKML